MTRTCRAPGCGEPASTRFSLYCRAHKTRLRRHGAIDQEGVTEAALGPYRRLVRARVKRNETSPLWAQLEDRWATVVNHAKGIVAAHERGETGYSHERKAAHEVIKVAGDVEAKAVVETALALFLMEGEQPRRFRSDAAFRWQMVRRVRGLTDLNAGTFYDHESGKVKRVYKDLTPRAVAVMGQWLADAFGGAGMHLAKMEERDREKAVSARQEMHQALEELK